MLARGTASAGPGSSLHSRDPKKHVQNSSGPSTVSITKMSPSDPCRASMPSHCGRVSLAPVRSLMKVLISSK